MRMLSVAFACAHFADVAELTRECRPRDSSVGGDEGGEGGVRFGGERG